VALAAPGRGAPAGNGIRPALTARVTVPPTAPAGGTVVMCPPVLAGAALPGTSIEAVGMTLQISEASPHQAEADAIVIGVTKEANGALPVPGTKDVDEALGGALAQTLATLGATGEAGEITRIPSGGRLAAPMIAAVGMGPAADGSDTAFDPEVLRRAAGAAVRALLAGRRPGSGGDMRIALALPARDHA
jgi:hypothetical protein